MPEVRVDAATLCRLLCGWTEEDAPLPRLLADRVADLMANNALCDGTVLPSQRQLASALGVARGTVTEAYEILAARDQLSTRQGSGTRVRRPGATASTGPPTGGRLSSFAGHSASLLDLSSGALPGLSMVLEALGRLTPGAVAEQLVTDGYHPAGLPRLRAAIAGQYTRDGVPTTAEQILVTSGAQQAVWLLAHMVVGVGDDVVVEDPCYRGALEAFRAGGANLIAVPVREHGLDLRQLRQVILRRRPRLLYCQPIGHNPSGVSMPVSARRELADLVTSQGVLTVEDSCSADLVLDGRGLRKPLCADTPTDITLSIGTSSKLLWGGLRVGWLRGSRTTISRLTEAKKAVDLAGAVIDQLITADLIGETGRARELRMTSLRASLQEAQDLLARRRPSWRWTSPAGGTGLWVDTGEDAVALAERGRRRRVQLAPGPAFSAFDGFRGHLRLPIWHPVADLAEGLDRLDS